MMCSQLSVRSRVLNFSSPNFSTRLLMPNPKVKFLQVEAVRKGTKAYKPRSSKPFIDLTIPQTQGVYPDISDHATMVASLWQAHGAGDLVDVWYVIEQMNWENAYLHGNKTTDPLPCPAHLVIEPCGSSLVGLSVGAVQKLNQSLILGNALDLVSPPDAGQGFYYSPCMATGSNILRVASSTTGSDMAGMPPIDVYFPTDWNSYVQPCMCAVLGLIPIFDWLLQNTIPYLASDIKTIVIATAVADSLGRKIFNGTAAFAAVKAKYAPVVLPPPLPPEPTPVTINPPPVTAPPTTTTSNPTSTPAPTQTTSPNGVSPTITRFDIGVSSAWSSKTAPTTFNIQTVDADRVTLTDPKGVMQDVTGKSQVEVEGVYTASSTWTLNAVNVYGTAHKDLNYVHGCF